MHIEEHKVPRGRPPKSDSEIGPKQLKRRAKKLLILSMRLLKTMMC